MINYEDRQFTSDHQLQLRENNHPADEDDKNYINNMRKKNFLNLTNLTVNNSKNKLTNYPTSRRTTSITKSPKNLSLLPDGEFEKAFLCQKDENEDEEFEKFEQEFLNRPSTKIQPKKKSKPKIILPNSRPSMRKNRNNDSQKQEENPTPIEKQVEGQNINTPRKISSLKISEVVNVEASPMPDPNLENFQFRDLRSPRAVYNVAKKKVVSPFVQPVQKPYKSPSKNFAEKSKMLRKRIKEREERMKQKNQKNLPQKEQPKKVPPKKVPPVKVIKKSKNNIIDDIVSDNTDSDQIYSEINGTRFMNKIDDMPILIQDKDGNEINGFDNITKLNNYSNGIYDEFGNLENFESSDQITPENETKNTFDNFKIFECNDQISPEKENINTFDNFEIFDSNGQISPEKVNLDEFDKLGDVESNDQISTENKNTNAAQDNFDSLEVIESNDQITPENEIHQRKDETVKDDQVTSDLTQSQVKLDNEEESEMNNAVSSTARKLLNDGKTSQAYSNSVENDHENEVSANANEVIEKAESQEIKEKNDEETEDSIIKDENKEDNELSLNKETESKVIESKDESKDIHDDENKESIENQKLKEDSLPKDEIENQEDNKHPLIEEAENKEENKAIESKDESKDIHDDAIKKSIETQEVKENSLPKDEIENQKDNEHHLIEEAENKAIESKDELKTKHGDAIKESITSQDKISSNNKDDAAIKDKVNSTFNNQSSIKKEEELLTSPSNNKKQINNSTSSNGSSPHLYPVSKPTSSMPQNDSEMSPLIMRIRLREQEARLQARKYLEEAREYKIQCQEVNSRVAEAQNRVRESKQEADKAREEAKSAKEQLEKTRQMMKMLKKALATNEIPKFLNDSNSLTNKENSEQKNDQNSYQKVDLNVHNEVEFSEDENDVPQNESDSLQSFGIQENISNDVNHGEDSKPRKITCNSALKSSSNDECKKDENQEILCSIKDDDMNSEELFETSSSTLEEIKEKEDVQLIQNKCEEIRLNINILVDDLDPIENLDDDEEDSDSQSNEFKDEEDEDEDEYEEETK